MTRRFYFNRSGHVRSRAVWANAVRLFISQHRRRDAADGANTASGCSTQTERLAVLFDHSDQFVVVGLLDVAPHRVLPGKRV